MSKVNCSHTLDMRVMPSMCDENSKMSLPAMLDMYQDVAGIHADMAGIGALEMEERGLFWIVSKIRLVVNERPLVGEHVQAATWIQPAERASCERDFSIAQDGRTLAYVRSMWAVLTREGGRLAHMDSFYPDSDFSLARPDDVPFARMSKKFDGAEEAGKYTIRSVDIDRGGHMNNVNYVRAMLGCFTCSEIAAMDIKELDMQFLAQCYEGDTLRFVKRPAPLKDSAEPFAAASAASAAPVFSADKTPESNGTSAITPLEIGALNEEGKVCFIAAIR